MSADFSAGSIEGVLTLDDRPFLAGLKRAVKAASDFEKHKISPEVDADTKPFKEKIDKAKKDADELGAKKPTVEPKLETAKFVGRFAFLQGLIDRMKLTTAHVEAKLQTNRFVVKYELVRGMIAKLRHDKADVKVRADTSQAMAKLSALNKILDAGGLSKVMNPGVGGAKIGALVAGIPSLVAAAIPAAGALTGIGAAATTAFGGAALSMGLFAKLVTSDVTDIQTATQKKLKITGPAAVMEANIKKLGSAWDGLKKKTESGVATLVGSAAGVASKLLPKFVPLMNTISTGLSGVVRTLGKLFESKGFGVFLKQLQAFMSGFLKGAGPVISDLLSSFFNAFSKLRPLMSEVGRGIETMASGLKKWTAGKGMTEFVNYAKREIPPTMALIKGILSAVGSIGKGLAPLAGPALGFVTALVKGLGSINLAPFSKGLGSVLKVVQPLIPVIVSLLNSALKPIGDLLGALAKGPLAAFTRAIGPQMKPVFSELQGALEALVGPLSAVLGSLANFVNPTGIALVTQLMGGLEGIVKKLAKPFGDLIVALESVIDNGIMILSPLLPPLMQVLGFLASVIAVVVEWVAKLISGNQALIVVLLAVWAVMAMNPVGLVITVLTLLVTGLIAAYEHSKTFRDVVTAALHYVGEAGTWLWNEALRPALKFIMTGFSDLMDYWAMMLGALGKIPGFGWAKDAAKKMHDAANEVHNLADGLKKLPTHVSLTLDTNLGTVSSMLASLRVQAAAGVKVATHYTTGISKTSADGNSLQGGEPSIVGEHGPEVWWPQQAGSVISTSRSHKLLAGLGGASLHSGPSPQQEQLARENNRLLQKLLDKIGSPSDIASAVKESTAQALRSSIQTSRAQ